MGGRAAYTLATALFVGGAGLFGYFGYLYAISPKATRSYNSRGREARAQSHRAWVKGLGLPRRLRAAIMAILLPEGLDSNVPPGAPFGHLRLSSCRHPSWLGSQPAI